MTTIETVTVGVLIVDDQEPFRSAARMVVQLAEGFEVIAEAETGEQAVELAAQLAPGLVLMDVNLPGIDGLEATRRICSGEAAPKVVLVLSTYDESEYGAMAVAAGAAAFVPKSELDPTCLEDLWRAATS